jgi:hypothetical protein
VYLYILVSVLLYIIIPWVAPDTELVLLNTGIIVPPFTINDAPLIVTFPPDVAPLKNCVPEPSVIIILPAVSAEIVNPKTPDVPENSILPDAGVILTPFAIFSLSSSIQQ